MEQALFPKLLIGWLVMAVVVFPLLFFVSAPYGRHNRKGWGPQVPRSLGWVLMEAPSPLLMLLFFALGNRHGNLLALTFLLIWLLHYIHRSFIFPFRMKGKGAQMPLLIVLFAFFFNLGNAYFNGRYLFSFAAPYTTEWLLDPRFIIGVLLFVSGLWINLHADNVLLRLRKGKDGGYQIPQGKLYDRISCPNYLGEVMEWCGWAIATWSLAGLAFALWTIANLVPRAIANHRWYQRTFSDYPKQRKAVIPYLL